MTTNVIDSLLSSQSSLTGNVDPATMREKLSALVEVSRQEGAQAEARRRETADQTLTTFRAQVVVHSAAREMMSMKLAMQDDKCWKCKTAPISDESPNGRCTACEAKDQDQ
jgi:hypothetical protein